MWIKRSELERLESRIASLESSMQRARNDINDNALLHISGRGLYSGYDKKPLKDAIRAILRHLKVDLRVVSGTPEYLDVAPEADFYPGPTITGTVTQTPIKPKRKSHSK
jgi:hypothetical protein